MNMWIESPQEQRKLIAFVKLAIDKKGYSAQKQDRDCLLQEVLRRILEVVKRDSSNDACHPISLATSFNRDVERYLLRVLDSAFFDGNRNIHYRKKSMFERHSIAHRDSKSNITIKHIGGGDIQGDVFDVMASEQPSPEMIYSAKQTAKQFYDVLTKLIEREKDKKKRQLFRAFFSREYRVSDLTQEQLGEKMGIQGKAAVVYINRFVAKLKNEMQESAGYTEGKLHFSEIIESFYHEDATDKMKGSAL